MNNLVKAARDMESLLNDMGDLLLEAASDKTNLKNMSETELRLLQITTQLIDTTNTYNLAMAYQMKQIDEKLDKLLDRKNGA